MRRSFNRVSVERGEGFKPGYKIRCSKCHAEADVACANHGGSLPPEVTRKKFVDKGWHVDDNPLRDVCPSCQKKQKPEKPEPQKVVPIAPAFASVAAAAEPPREMTREDRRIIFGKLNEVYIDEARGYDAGWNDQRVADDLGVPLAWVREIREENFGAESLPAADQKTLDEIAALRGLVEEKISNIETKMEAVPKLRERAREVWDAFRELGESVAEDINALRDLRDRAAQMEKDVARIRGSLTPRRK